MRQNPSFCSVVNITEKSKMLRFYKGSRYGQMMGNGSVEIWPNFIIVLSFGAVSNFGVCIK